MRSISGWTVPLLFGLMLGSATLAGDAEPSPEPATASSGTPAEADPAALELIEHERIRAAYDAAMTAMENPLPGRETDPMILQEAASAILPLGAAVRPFLEFDAEGSSRARFGAAIHILGRIDDPGADAILRRVIDRLDGAGKHIELRELMWTVVALASRGPDDILELVARLDPELARSAYTAGWTTLDTVAVVRGERSRATLLGWLEELAADPSGEATVRLVTTIGALAHLPSPEIVEPIARLAAEHPSWRVRRAAVGALTAAGTDAAIATLIGRVRDPAEDDRVRVDAAHGIEILRPGDRTTEILEILETAEHPYVRGALYRALACIMGAEALPAFYSHRGRRESADRAALMQAVGLTGAPDGIRLLREGLADPDSTVALRAVLEIGTLGTPAARETLLATLNDPRSTIRRHAVDQLVRLGEKRAAPRISDRLVREELSRPATRPEARTVVRNYGEALVEFADTTALDDIRTRIDRQGDPDLKSYLLDLVVRLTAIHDLGVDVEAWSAKLAAPEPSMRRVAIRTLARIATDASASALTRGFIHATHEDRIEILRAFGERAEPRARPLLEQVLLSEEFDIRDGPILRSWAAWVAQEIGDADGTKILERSSERREGLDGDVLIRPGVLRGVAVVDRIDGYRDSRLLVPYWFRGEEQDRIDGLVRDLRAGRGADRFREQPSDHGHD